MTYAPADDKFIALLRKLLPEQAIRGVEPRYLEEPRGRYHGAAGVVVAPGDTREVSQAIMAAQELRVPVIPYGGGTGLVGGQIMEGDAAPMILSLERMNRIRSVNPQDNIAEVEAGVTLAELHAAAEAKDRLFGLSIASKGTARVGGILATNAGGVGVLRYGTARELCLGLEAVLPNGKIWKGLSRLRKNNMGYDLRDLLIGSEGTLGVITAATLKLHPRPAGEATALFAVSDPAAALALLTLARARLGEGVSAFELIGAPGIDFQLATGLLERAPLDPMPGWMVLIDIGLARGLDPQEALADLFAEAADDGLASDGVIARSETQRAQLWSLRENIPEANRRIGAISSHDTAVPLAALPDFIRLAEERLARIGRFRTNCFGHMGDGNLHFNVFPPQGKSKEDFTAQREDVKVSIHDLAHELGGTVSAEHGVGRLKVYDLERYGDPVGLAMMRAIKQLFDPEGIMNPGAVLRLD